MGAEGQQDIEMAILTALLKGELFGNSDSWPLDAGRAWGFAPGQETPLPLLPGTVSIGDRLLSPPGCLELSQCEAMENDQVHDGFPGKGCFLWTPMACDG